MSYGITTIGTSIGGIPEMLDNTNNILLGSNPSTEDVELSIEKVIEITRAGTVNNGSYDKWLSNYYEFTNNVNFINDVTDILNK